MAVRVKQKHNTTKSTSKPKGRREEEDDDVYEDDDDEEFDDEEDRPRNKKGKKGKKGKDKSSKNKAKSRSDKDDDDDEDDALVGGWGAHHRNKAETSNFPNRLDLKADPALVMFLEDEPLVSYKMHWIERKGKRSFYCIGKDCPLCNNGDKPSVKNVFNLVRLDEGMPLNLVLETGPKLSDILESKSTKTPLSRGYWSVARHGTGGTTNFDVNRVKERDLEEDWEVKPVSEKALKKLVTAKWKQADVVQVNTRKELAQIAKEMTGDYDEDDD